MMNILDKRPAHEIAREAINALAHEFGLDMRAEFVPFSRSRNAKPREGQDKAWQSLNWRVTLTRGDRDILTTDYAQGVAHTPAHNAPAATFDKWQRSQAIALEIETGRIAKRGFGSTVYEGKRPIAPPALADVLCSLALASSVLDFARFEDWAADYGYDADSRSAESIYRECLTIALALRAAIGDSGLEKLREAASEM